MFSNILAEYKTQKVHLENTASHIPSVFVGFIFVSFVVPPLSRMPSGKDAT